MPVFDFISGDDFRLSLESDARELLSCVDAKSYKAVHVLAGSIIEAILADHLVSVDYKKTSGKDPLKMELAQLVDACKSLNVLSDRTADLSSAVRSYRNLIHPGRVIRLDEVIDANSAQIAAALVEVIAADVAKRRKEQYGLTAEQFIAKLETDPSSVAILGDLYKGTSEAEIERLLLRFIPERYILLSASEPDDSAVMSTLRDAYRAGLVTDRIRKKAAAEAARVIRQEPEHVVMLYETALFDSDDLDDLGADDQAMVKHHLLAQASARPSEEFFHRLEGLGRHLDQSEAAGLVDTVVRWATADPKRRRAAGDFLETLWNRTPVGPDEWIRERVVTWSRSFVARQQEEMAVWADRVSEAMVVPEMYEGEVGEKSESGDEDIEYP